ncbi:IS110 family RNA-guided transposase [Amedibacillus sp. YH-ame10]
MTYFIGVDIAKYTHYACIINHFGEVHVPSFAFENTMDGFQSFLNSFSSFSKDDIIIGFESTAHYHENLYHFLSHLNYHCELINPLLTKRFRGLSIRDVKTDKVDAYSIACFLSFNHSKSNISSFHINDLKYLCLERENLKKKKSSERIRLTALLDRAFPELKPYLKNSIYSKGFLNLFKEVNTAHQIKTTRIDRLYNLINAERNFCSKDKVSQIKSLASSSVGFHSDALSFYIKNTVLQIELFEQQLASVKVQIIECMKRLDSPLLKIPGFGYIQAAYILATIENISRFDNPSKVLAFAGLDPKIRQSGLFKAHKTRMSKRGNKMLRYALIWSANNVRKNSIKMNAYYAKKRSEGKAHYNALGHCAKKLVNYIFFVLQNPDKEFILD